MRNLFVAANKIVIWTWCEFCCDRQEFEFEHESGTWEYYKCSVCGNQKGFRVR